MRQFSLHILLKPILAVFLLSGWTYISLILLDVRTIKTKMLVHTQLQKENNIPKRQFLYLAGRIEEMKQKIMGLEEADREIEKMVNLGNSNGPKHLMGVGGSDPGLLQPDYSEFNTHQEPVQFIPHFLDDINHKINVKDVMGTEDEPSLPKEKCQDKEESVYSKGSLNNGDRVKIQKHLKAIANELGIDPRLALSMAKVESGYNPSLVSPRGAVGVLQVIPQFVRPDYGITREMLFDPQINIRVGLSRMKSLLNRFDYDLDLSLAAYNAGASRVVKAGYRIPSIEETEAYVRKVKEIMENEV